MIVTSYVRNRHLDDEIGKNSCTSLDIQSKELNKVRTAVHTFIEEEFLTVSLAYTNTNTKLNNKKL